MFNSNFIKVMSECYIQIVWEVCVSVFENYTEWFTACILYALCERVVCLSCGLKQDTESQHRWHGI